MLASTYGMTSISLQRIYYDIGSHCIGARRPLLRRAPEGCQLHQRMISVPRWYTGAEVLLAWT